MFSLADLLLIFVATIWGINVTVVKKALTELNPLAFNSLRFAISAGLSWVVLGVAREKPLPRGKDLPALIVLGLLGHTLYQVLFIYGTNSTTASNTALLLATIPIWVAALGAITREEVAGPLTWLGIGLSLFGIALVTGGGNLSVGGGTLGGDLMLVAGTFFYGLYVLKSKALLGKYSPVQYSTWTTTVGALGLSALSLRQLGAQDWGRVGVTGWGGLAFSAVLAIALGYFIWSYGIQKLGSARAAIYNNLTPVTGLIFSSVFLKEKITALQVGGIVLIITGLTLARRKKLHRRQEFVGEGSPLPPIPYRLRQKGTSDPNEEVRK